MLAHEAQQLGVDRRPDRAPRATLRRRRGSQRVAARGRLAAARRVRPSTRPAPRCAGRAACARPRRRSSTSRCGPTRKRPISSSGLWVALRPIRWISSRAPAGAAPEPAQDCASRRSSVSARWAPRLECATAWISSTITASTPLSISRACEVRIRYSDSGVVIEDVRRLAQPSPRARAGACRRCGSRRARPPRADAAQRGAQVALDVVGERLQRADVDHARCPARRPARRLGRTGDAVPAARIAAQPVERPQERGERLARAGGRRERARARRAAIAGQACAWAGVGVGEGLSRTSRAPRGLKLDRGLLADTDR